ncbi:MAG TPA: LuxR family transcriptional regulator [Verrucomicrobiae bacterium]|nr:LuxR family transcriptional regulator [Verrucomicrobiae bacterium]
MKPLNRNRSPRRSVHPPTRPSHTTSGPSGSQLESKLADYSLRPARFIFLDKTSGAHCFEIVASSGGCLASEQAASLLAMHCLGRWRIPEDFCVMVPADEEFLAALAARTRELIASCTFAFPSIHLSPRQKDVLREVLQQRSNKEIAAELNVSERTAKFHVSALLQKFNVQSRMRLIQQASDGLRLGVDPPPVCADSPAPSVASAAAPALHLVSASSVVPTPGPLKFQKGKHPSHPPGHAGGVRSRAG